MKIIAIDHWKDGVTLETVQPHLRAELEAAWRLSKAGIIREMYSRTDRIGVVCMFECDSLEICRAYVDDFPLSKAGMIAWDLVPLKAPLPLEYLFDPAVDVKEPFDRTMPKA